MPEYCDTLTDMGRGRSSRPVPMTSTRRPWPKPASRRVVSGVPLGDHIFAEIAREAFHCCSLLRSGFIVDWCSRTKCKALALSQGPRSTESCLNEPFVVGFKSFKIFKRRDPINRLHFRQCLCQRVRPRPSNPPEQHVRAAGELESMSSR